MVTYDRLCLACGNIRIPATEVVAEKKVRYVIYTCPVCHRHDIERFSDRPRPKLWNGREFADDGGYIDDQTI